MKTTVARSRRGFTLVELTIVIAILGILAAIVLPRVTGATDLARSNGAYSQLTTVRKQLEVWKLDHGGNFPTLSQLQEGASDWDVMISKTTAAGVVDAAGTKGPYFTTPPMNPFTSSTLVVAAGAPVGSAGWTYAASTGVLKVILPASILATTTELGENDYEQLAP